MQAEAEVAVAVAVAVAAVAVETAEVRTVRICRIRVQELLAIKFRVARIRIPFPEGRVRTPRVIARRASVAPSISRIRMAVRRF
jgi:hypothetical protein